MPSRHMQLALDVFFFFSSRRRHTRFDCDGVQTCALPILERVPFSDDPRQPLRAPVAWGDAQLPLRLAEGGVLAGNAEVAGHGELAAAAQRVAVDGRDDGLATGFEAPQHRLAAQRAGLAVERPLLREVADVGARYERLRPGAGEDCALDRALGRHPVGGVGQLIYYLIVQRVELVGPVDGDERDGVFDLEEERLVSHGRNPTWTMRNAECGMRNYRASVVARFDPPLTLRIPHSEFRISLGSMTVQAIAWSPTGAVRIVDQRALPEACIERDLESVEAVADAIRTLQVRGAPLIGIAAAMGLVAGGRGVGDAPPAPVRPPLGPAGERLRPAPAPPGRTPAGRRAAGP